MMQLTNMTSSAPSGIQSLNMTYNFSSTQNNGRIVSSSDAVTGENVSYTYDSLNRLIAAATTNKTGPTWGDSYSYDGFGNLTSKSVTQGTAPSVSPQVNSATNQARMIGDYGFDANGNWLGAGGSQSNTWNVENQLISNGSVDPSGDLLTYTYDPWGKRVLQYGAGANGVPAGGTVYFYSIGGQRLGTYQISYVLANDPPLPQSTTLYFGSRLLAPVDRLGSVRGTNGPAYFPWGEERTSTPDGTDKFATYFRDVTSNGVGEDYANARYYNNNFGRFWSPDPAGNGEYETGRTHRSPGIRVPSYRPGLGAAKRRVPLSWNRYVYALDDPVNLKDPRGLDCVVGASGNWADDGTGCSYADTWISTWGSISDCVVCLSDTSSTITFGVDDDGGTALEKTALQILDLASEDLQGFDQLLGIFALPYSAVGDFLARKPWGVCGRYNAWLIRIRRNRRNR